ncbi:MAG: hypothetical protein JWP11_1164 [Frankiales bacterium]|jgi:BMFP domain-containing protein YqiC|nr:hypothetical protein [Frankiales bacterium]
MSTPGRDEPRGGLPLTPARRGRDRGRPEAAAETAAIDDADLQRGLASAVLAAMGRVQLKLDALSRQQTDAFLEMRTRLAALEARVAAAEAAPRLDGHTPVPGPPGLDLRPSGHDPAPEPWQG